MLGRYYGENEIGTLVRYII